MLKKGEIKQKEALEILSEKQPISKPTFIDWCNRGIIKFRTEEHGVLKLKYRVFKRSEIKRIKSLLPKERVLGLPLISKK